MQSMFWKMEIIHCNNDWLVKAEYWLQLGENICFDPLMHEYEKQTADLQLRHPVPTGQVLAQNMQIFRGSCQSASHVTTSMPMTKTRTSKAKPLIYSTVL